MTSSWIVTAQSLFVHLAYIRLNYSAEGDFILLAIQSKSLLLLFPVY
jgi:hypothetical protein